MTGFEPTIEGGAVPLAGPRPPVTLIVHGQPAPQGSKRAFMGKRKDGTPVARVIESSHDRVKSWRQAVVDQARETMAPSYIRDRFPLDGPLELAMLFWLHRPKGHYRTGRNAHLLRDSAPQYPHGKPDVSKLCRATEDALTDAGIWADDAQVVRYTGLAKEYADRWSGLEPFTGRLTPGAVITIRQIPPPT